MTSGAILATAAGSWRAERPFLGGVVSTVAGLIVGGQSAVEGPPSAGTDDSYIGGTVENRPEVTADQRPLSKWEHDT